MVDPAGVELIAQISDSHVQAGPGDVEASEALARAVAAVAELEPAPVAVLFTGDLTEHGHPAEYERVRELLAPLQMPVHPLAGNHDDREALMAAFADHPGIAGASQFVQYEARCGSLRLIAVDTVLPGSDAGRLNGERLEWIESVLRRRADGPTILALHHPPIQTGLTEFDELIGLPAAERAVLAEMVAQGSGVALVAAGHVHRTIAARIGGAVMQVCPSVYLQAKLDFRPGAPILLIPETAGFVIHVAQAGGGPDVVSHLQTIEG